MQAVPLADVSSTHPADTSSTASLPEHYDFIVIGGGTAGLVVAARLSEDSKVKVLVIEAGPNRKDDSNILTPGLGFAMYDNPDYDWCFSTVPQKHLNGRTIPTQRGKVLGGSSAIYQMQMVYSSRGAYDAWEKMGNPGWNWSTMLPYLRKFHTHQPPHCDEPINDISHVASKDEAVESQEGPVQTSYSDTYPVDKDWFVTWQNILSALEYGGKDGIGGIAQPTAIDAKTRTRSYAATAYYSADISARPNLRVVTESLAEKIFFEKGTDIVVSGVQFVSKSGKIINVSAKKEVVLSAGAIASPHLLELSGIGCPKLLARHGIAVVVENPNVGENLQDHAMAPISFEAKDGVQTGDPVMRDPTIMKTLLDMYAKDRSGPMGHNFVDAAQFRVPETFGPNGGSFIPSLLETVTPDATTESERLKNDLTSGMLSQATIHYMMLKAQLNVLGHSKITAMARAESEGNYLTIFAALNHPYSRGSVHIQSSSPLDAPAIDPKYLSHPMDLELLARHVQFLSTFITTPPYSNYIKPMGRRIPAHAFPHDREQTLDETKGIVRDVMISNYHPAGTCTMASEQLGGVVDGRLRVYGVKGLRVVDASIFPLMPRGNIITSVYAVAERASDMIKEDWNMV